MSIPRTHRVSLYDWEEFKDADRWSSTAAATLVECNLQPRTGAVAGSPPGREVQADWKGFFDQDQVVTEDQGVLVTHVWDTATEKWVAVPGAHRTTFRITSVGWQGSDFDTEAMLSRTKEEIPGT